VPPHRRLIPLGIAVVALFAVIFPPWRARAIRTTSRYAAVSGLAPSIVVDTIDWLVPFAAIYAPPRPWLTGDRMRELAARAIAGDSAARRRLSDSTTHVEQRYHAPEALLADGEVWRDSVLTAAGIPAVSSYDLAFTIDRGWVAARLVVLALLGLSLEWRSRRRRAPKT
jgi:hypothetical protein